MSIPQIININHETSFEKKSYEYKNKSVIIPNTNNLTIKKGPYTWGCTWGEGAFAKVKLARNIETNEPLAIKIIDKEKVNIDQIDINKVKKEIQILKKIRHKNIIQLYEIMESKHNWYICMEYCDGNELFEYIVKYKRLMEDEACKWFQQWINGVEYWHQQGVVHRDLKPENIWMNRRGEIKISDFGLSTFYSKGSWIHTPCGTPSYAPPEMWIGEDYDGEVSDIWSCGVIWYAMLCGSIPFAESKEEIIYRKIIQNDYIIPDYISDNARDWIQGMLRIDPKERFTIETIKKHSWFNLTPPEMRPGWCWSVQKSPVDEAILAKIKDYGLDVDKCREEIMMNKYDSLTTIYYWLVKKHIDAGGVSICDLVSDKFIKYVESKSSYIANNDDAELNRMTTTCSTTKDKLTMYGSVFTEDSEGNSSSTTTKVKNTSMQTIMDLESISKTISKQSQKHLDKQLQYRRKRQERAVQRHKPVNVSNGNSASNTIHISKTYTNPTKNKRHNKTESEVHSMKKKVINSTALDSEDLHFEEELKKIDSIGTNANVIQYIAQKWIGNSFCWSFDISRSSNRTNLINKIDYNEWNNNHSTNKTTSDLIRNQIISKERTGISNGAMNRNPSLKHTNCTNTSLRSSVDKGRLAFIKKKEVYIYDKTENGSNCAEEPKTSSYHKNKFLDISTNALEASIERSISTNKNCGSLNNSSRNSPNEKKKINIKYFDFNNECNRQFSSSSSKARNKFITKINIISEVDDEENWNQKWINGNGNSNSNTLKKYKGGWIKKAEIKASQQKNVNTKIRKLTTNKYLILYKSEEWSSRGGSLTNESIEISSGKKRHIRTKSAYEHLENGVKQANSTVKICLNNKALINKKVKYMGSPGRMEGNPKINLCTNTRLTSGKVTQKSSFKKRFFSEHIIDPMFWVVDVSLSAWLNKMQDYLKKEKVSYTKNISQGMNLKCAKGSLLFDLSVYEITDSIWYIKGMLKQGDMLLYKKIIQSMIWKFY